MGKSETQSSESGRSFVGATQKVYSKYTRTVKLPREVLTLNVMRFYWCCWKHIVGHFLEEKKE